MRPKSLAEVAELTLNGGSFDLSLKNFLDEFYAHPSFEALATEPKRLSGAFSDIGLVQDAYLAATAESLGNQAGINTPDWAYAESRKLSRPWFALEYASLRALLLWESPAAFRSRNLFVSNNALTRA
ncbi:hypothetical protein [Pedosphaera parvula]|uniref:Uncharacterized protein n=1 Tax=Pedosphaera parvula (strain Ellin514) TaxID=320771 RepID=B9XMP4_PEDPL|nr:hypothetical protein [Pedosphaera parvula]EEF58943.1 conserved hypothetical protein [Pedosphaera parvula Ellin514]